jgi:transcriptional accessory protein Tex/SPT6
MIHRTLSCIFFIGAFHVYAQDLSIPVHCNQYQCTRQYFDKMKLGLEACAGKYSEEPDLNSKSKKQIKQAYQGIIESLYSYDTACRLMQRDELSKYLNTIVVKLQKDNQRIRNDYKLLLLRNT